MGEPTNPVALLPELLPVLREHGVHHCKVGDVEVVLEPRTRAPQPDAPMRAETKDERRARLKGELRERAAIFYRASGAVLSEAELNKMVDHELAARGET